MVGVPGRSKSCNTCRSRKKGCSKQRPSCSQCVKAGLVCGGYERERVWVNTPQETFNGAATYSRPTAPEEAVPGQLTLDYTSHNNAGTVTLHDNLARTAREDLYLGHYWTMYHPCVEGQDSSTVSCFSTTGWTGVVRDLYNKESALRYAMFALSLSTLSVHNNDAGLRMRGLQAYSTAVRKLTYAVAQPNRSTEDGLLAAIRLMCFYEILFGASPGTEQSSTSPQVKGWHNHLKGEQSMFRLRGPASFVSGPAHKLFVNGRLQIIMSGVTDRRRTLFGADEWKTIPWIKEQKTPKDKILDILADVPGHFEDLDTLRSCYDPQKALDLCSRLQADCDRACKALEQWKAEMGPSIEKYDYSETISPLSPPKSIKDLDLLYNSHLYWMTCAAVYSTVHFCWQAMANIDDAGFSTPGSSNFDSYSSGASSLDRDSATDPVHYAKKIAHSIHLFSEPEYRLSSFHAAIIPLGIAMRILRLFDIDNDTQQEQMLLINYSLRPYMGSYASKFIPNIQHLLHRIDTK